MWLSRESWLVLFAGGGLNDRVKAQIFTGKQNPG